MSIVKIAVKIFLTVLILLGLLYGAFKLFLNGVATVRDETGDVVSVAANYGDYDVPFSYAGFGMWVRIGVAHDASVQLRCRDGSMAETGYLTHTGHTHVDIDETCNDMP